MFLNKIHHVYSAVITQFDSVPLNYVIYGERALENIAVKLSDTDVDGNTYRNRRQRHIILLCIPCNNIVKIQLRNISKTDTKCAMNKTSRLASKSINFVSIVSNSPIIKL